MSIISSYELIKLNLFFWFSALGPILPINHSAYCSASDGSLQNRLRERLKLNSHKLISSNNALADTKLV